MNNVLKMNTPATCFKNSFLLGNGHLGAAVYGGVATERYSLNESTLWSGYPQKQTNPNAKETFLKAQQLVLNGQPLKASELLAKNFTGSSSQFYLPLCNLFIDHGERNYTHYERSLNMQTGVLKVAYSGEDYDLQRESFVSHPGRVLAVKITQKNVPLTKVYLNSVLQCNICLEKCGLVLRGTAPTVVHEAGKHYPWGEHLPVYFEEEAKKGMRYKASLKIESNGEVRVNGNEIQLLNATEIVIYFAARTSFNGFDRHPYLEGAEIENTCNKDIEKAVLTGYEALKAAHIADFSELYNRTVFSLGEDETELPTDQLLKEHNNNALYEQLFSLGKYLTISGSRKGGQPLNLQGIWNEYLAAPWNSNYTLNINAEMNYMPTLALNLPECFEPYERLAKELAVSGRSVAKEWYGIKGTVAHHNTDIWRLAHPVGDQVPWNTCYAFFNTSLGWILFGLCEKYRLSGDRTFLRETLYPLLTECAESFIQLLVEVEDGKLALVPATSPENCYLTENGERADIALYSAMNNAICRDVFSAAAEFSLVLHKNKKAERYSAYGQKLVPYAIGPDGRILEWDQPYREVEVNHRHVSHLYGLHPAKEITPYGTPELAKAAAASLNARGDEGTGWCIAWKANMWARLFEGDRALKLLDTQLKYVEATEAPAVSLSGGTYPTLLCAHQPFQIDGNFGATSAIIEMLVQANGKDIYLLPALPKRWPNGEIKGIAIPGGAFVDLKWKNGTVCDVKITPESKAEDYRLMMQK